MCWVGRPGFLKTKAPTICFIRSVIGTALFHVSFRLCGIAHRHFQMSDSFRFAVSRVRFASGSLTPRSLASLGVRDLQEDELRFIGRDDFNKSRQPTRRLAAVDSPDSAPEKFPVPARLYLRGAGGALVLAGLKAERRSQWRLRPWMKLSLLTMIWEISLSMLELTCT
jgi:hypothetical protein